MHIIPFTQSGFDNLKKQLETEVDKRPDAVKALQRGREMGDLSENGLYKAAKMELSNIDRQIRFLKNLIKYARVSVPQGNSKVQLGHFVVIENNSGQKNYRIVGEYEANPKEGRISFMSPIGHHLMGKSAGEKFLMQTPGGTIEYKILSIDN
jgi:transcription elongation factor GreA